MVSEKKMSRTVTLIPGDAIGPEVSQAAVRVAEAAGADLEWETHDAGSAALASHGEPLPDELVDSIRRNKVALKGPVTTPIGEGFRSVNVELRKILDLYVNLRPVYSMPSIPSRFDDVDLVVVRENTEGLYSGLEHEVVPGVMESLKIITARASRRISEFAFEYARREGRRRITAVHKANIMKLSDGLFLECFREVSARYPDIVGDEGIVDAMCMELVMRPEEYDVLVLPNLYGDIVSDLCAGLVGGLGVVAGANLGDEVAVFEAVHGSAPDIAGRDVANPIALIRSTVLMLEHLHLEEAARRVRAGLEEVTVRRRMLTRDLGGTATTTEFTDQIVDAIEHGAGESA